MIINSQQSRGVTATLSALGFQVSDPDVTEARAHALGAAPVARFTTAGESRLAGMTSPDGTEFYFAALADTPQWGAEFGTDDASSAPSDRGVSGIDHVNLSQPWGAFDETVLFIESLLPIETRPATEVPSPRGLVRSQAMEGGDGAVRLALNVVPQVLSARQSAATSTRRSSGASRYPEHIAFATNDIIAVARRARDAGMDFLPVPQNYYDDLDARFSLDPELLDDLRSLDLLYDREGDTEFLHFYTETVGDLFFEVVERRSGYQGYGAPNAAVRLAAQFERSARNRGMTP